MVAIATLGGWISWRSYNSLKDQQRANVRQLAIATAATVDQFIARSRESLVTLGSDPSFAAGDRLTIQRHLGDLNNVGGDFTGGTAWIDAGGTLRASAPRVAPRDLGWRRDVRAALDEGRSAVATTVGPMVDLPAITIAIPTRAPDGTVNGVLTGSVNLPTLASLTRGLEPEGMDLRVVDRAGNLVIGGALTRLEQAHAASPVAQMRREGSGTVEGVTGPIGRPDRLLGFKVLPDPDWLVVTGILRTDAFASARRSFRNELLSLLAALFVVVGATVFGARRLRREHLDEDRRRARAERLRDTAERLISATSERSVNTITCEAIAATPTVAWCAILDGNDGSSLAQAGPVPARLALLPDRDDQPAATPVAVQPALRANVTLDDDVASSLRLFTMRLPGGETDAHAMIGLRASPTPGELDEIGAIGEDASQARARAALIARERVLRAQTELIADVGANVEAALGVDARMQRLVASLVPDFADMAMIEVDDGAAAPHVAVDSGVDIGARQNAGILATARQAGATLLRSSDPRLEAIPAAAVSDDDGVRFLVVPIRSGERVAAALLLGRNAESPPFVPEELTVAQILAERVAMAFDQARLYEEQRDIAFTLQDSLLGVPELAVGDQVTMAAQYRPGEGSLEIGGDWFDCIPLADGSVALAIGDVVGHGLSAAAAMGKLSSALRALALNGAHPQQVLQRLDVFARSGAERVMATVASVVLDPRTGVIEYAAAGHPPPLLIEPDGTTTFLWDGRTGPLSATRTRIAPPARATMCDGACIVLFTDGLIERRGEHIDDSLARLADAARRVFDRSPHEMAAALVAEMLGGRRLTDDAVVMVTRLGYVGRRHRQRFPATPRSLASIREVARSWLAAVGPLTSDERRLLLLGLGEATANAVEHAYRAGQGSLHIELREHPRGVTMCVTDAGQWRTEPPSEDRGRGLDIISQLFDEVHVATDDTGTAIRMEYVFGARSKVTS